jgi:hypothetical protein
MNVHILEVKEALCGNRYDTLGTLDFKIIFHQLRFSGDPTLHGVPILKLFSMNISISKEKG